MSVPTLAQVVETETKLLVDTVNAVEDELLGLATDPKWLSHDEDMGSSTLEEILIYDCWLPPDFYVLSGQLHDLSGIASRLAGHIKTLIELRNVQPPQPTPTEPIATTVE